MAYSPRFGPPGRQLGGFVTPAIKWILLSNSVIFVVYYLSTVLGIEPLLWVFRSLSLIPDWVVRGALWQPVTYLFLHSPYGFNHILFNMLMTWMFGADLERDWGTRKFVNFYLFCGVGAGLCDLLARFVMGGDTGTATIGNSGAVYGVLLAFGLCYPNRTIYFWMLFPIPARIFVLIMGVLAFLMTIGDAGSSVSHIAHLGGMVFAYINLRYRPDLLDFDWVSAYRQWKLKRARRKFEVYMRKRDRSDGGGGWVN